MNIHIIYATEVGTTKYVAEVIKNELHSLGHQVDLYLIGADGYQPKLKGYDLLLFGSPTYYNGQVPSSMRRYLENFDGTLDTYKIGVFSLGERIYPDFCASAEILEKWIIDHHGSVVVPALKVDGFPKQHDEIKTWITSVLAAR